ncbi:hypothetical protein SAMN02927900_02070 [Rhizobium mongolense subsp. loessense]|uniref:Uncharacterized protein n=1 Tax=Rhizobium mongolense subsp. loessense TaxID=158890 RepID=A0A1G4QZJ0_9HYPH|nr:hypothetical protein SAMN02927900_02070 [Rhizobium mongolense subsp. loessense]
MSPIKDTRVNVDPADRGFDRLSDDFGGARISRMALDHDRAPGRQCGRRIVAGG